MSLLVVLILNLIYLRRILLYYDDHSRISARYVLAWLFYLRDKKV